MTTKKKTAPKKNVKKTAPPAKKTAKKSAPPRKASKAPMKTIASKPAAKVPAKKIAPKKTPLKKVAVKKIAVKKIVVKKAAAKKAVAKKAAPKKALPKKAAPQKAAPKKIVSPTASAAAPATPSTDPKGKPHRAFRKDELLFFRSHLQQHLELIQGNLNALAGDNLKRSLNEPTGDVRAHSTHMADQGTDNFDRELALNLASSRQDSIYDIEDAIRRVDDGTYGACEACGCAIERPRLKALPFAKKCVACQNAAERGRTKYRPFGGTLPLQQLAAEDIGSESHDSMS